MNKTTLSFLVLTISVLNPVHADSVMVFNEVMYHPATNEPAMEWIELRNQHAVDVDVSHWTLTNAIQYRFPANTIVRGRSYIVVALSPSTITNGTGLTNVLGPFLGRLGNDGETIELRNNSGRLLDSLSYGVEDEWPVAPDGSGCSLAKLDRESASGPGRNWTWSEQIGGTPGRDNFPLLGAALAEMRLFATDSAWKYEASGTDLGTAWTAPGYGDGGWGAGAAWLYNGSYSVGETRSIPTLFNTGIGTNGAALSVGSRDPHFTIASAAQGPTNTNAVAMANNAAWVGNDNVSGWIGIVDSGNANVSGGGYNYLTRFSNERFVSGTLRIDMNIAVDDQCTNIFLNGTPTGLSASGFAAFNPTMSITSGFAAGTNTLEFRTVNGGLNPHGFRVNFNATGLMVLTNTALPAGPSAYYFRKSFVFAGDPTNTALRLNAIVDDGAVFYLNGAEVYRANMPDGAVSYATPAVSPVATPAYTGPIAISATNLVAGTNVFAVEVHQAAGDTSDMLFGAELIALPMIPPPVALAFNEILGATNASFFLELMNHGTNTYALEDFVIYRDGRTNFDQYVFPPGVSLGPNQFLALTNTTLDFEFAAGDKLFLYSPGKTKIYDAVVVKRRHRGRSPNGTGAWLYPSAPTAAAPNTFAFRNEIVINEIMYHHQLLPATNPAAAGPPGESPEAWIELYNRSVNTVDLSGWELTGGVSYQFDPGTMIGAGEYLVIADDAVALRALYPGIDIVGNLGGRLSHGGERIVLSDPNENPGDELHYHDSGRWPGYADGGGSSLELRDPNADNSKAEAWAASDESHKTSWQSYSYRMVANIPALSGQPTQWNELVLGLLEAGECLIDDISVVESPTNNPIQFIANGDFENGVTGWRVLGTHNRSRVEVDPDAPGNHALHVVATGSQEHMHNHIETTYLAGRSVVNGREYQISFRARCLAGSSLLNTRLYFNRVARTTALPVPALNGTPGARNSRSETNIGPTFSNLRHEPVIPQPAGPVTVSITAQDPQGVTNCALWWSTNGGPFMSAAMTVGAVSPSYAGSIPGYPAGTVVQFYVRALDGMGAAATFPARGPDSGALYKVDDGQARLALSHNVRVIMTPANIDLMHNFQNIVGSQTNVMSNDLLPCTVVYDEQRAYYECGIHLRGSQRGRYHDVRTGFHIEFQPDDLFRGVYPVMLVDRSGQGDSAANRQEEIVLKHMLNRAGGIPGTYADIAHLIAPRGVHTGPAQFFPRHEDVVLESAFENGGDGTLFEMELIYYPTTANAAGYKYITGPPPNDQVIATDMTDLGNDKEIYRYNFMIKNHRDVDDYSAFITLCKAWSLTGSALDAATRPLMDLDQWMRAYALISLCSVGDMYTFGNAHNFFIYQRPSDGKFLYFPWDMDFVFSRGANGALIGDQNLGNVVRLPGNLRCLYAHMLDIIDISFNASYMAYWCDHYDNFAPGQNYVNTSLAMITARVPFVISAINTAGGNAPFNVTTNSTTTTNNLITLSGTAPVQVKTIKVNGVDYPVTWTSISNWVLRVPVSQATNTLLVQSCDVHDNVLSNFNRTVTVNYTGPAVPAPEGLIVMNEIMYNPLVPEAAWVEIFNTSSYAFDLSNWHLNGLDFIFPSGTIMTNGQFLVLGKSSRAFALAHGPGLPLLAEYEGQLDDGGETLSLIKPGLTPAQDVVVDRVTYDDDPPWLSSPDGQGPSLQLIDARQDNNRVSNWSDGSGWRFFSTNGNVGTLAATRLFVFLDKASDVYIDNISLVTGNVPEAGSNVLSNGDFESPLSGPWGVQGSHAQSALSTDIKYAGNSSLHIVATGAGTPVTNNCIWQDVTITASTVYTLSYWFLTTPTTNRLTTRLNSAFRPENLIRPVPFTPGAANSTTALLPPYPRLWLSEVQPNNVSGVSDNSSEIEPWIEIYNSGAAVLNLDGYYLANNYTNVTQWAFPSGAAINPGQYVVVWADGEPGETSGTNWHTSFRLNPTNGSIALSRSLAGAPQVLDYINYGDVGTNRSYGSFPDGQLSFRQLFYFPTPGGSNNPAAPPVPVRINEWMAANANAVADPADGDFEDWFELYNPTTNVVNLAGYTLTDTLGDPDKYTIPAGITIAPGGFLLVWADEESEQTATNGDLHVNFRLDADPGEMIRLYHSSGQVVDTVTFGMQTNDVTQGRWPDGQPAPYFFMTTPTPGAPNVVPTPPEIRIVNIMMGPNAVTLTWSAQAGQSYRVQFKNDLGETDWNDLAGDVTAVGANASKTDSSVGGVVQRFYRIIIVE